MTKEEENTLREAALFDSFSEEETDRLCRILGWGERRYERGGALFHAGDPIRACGMLLSGAVQVFLDDVNGNHIVMAHVEPGALFGEAMVCSGMAECPISAVALQDCTVLWLRGDLLTMPDFYGDPLCARFGVSFMRAMAERTLRFNDRIQVLSKRSIRDKLITFFSQKIRQEKSRELVLEMDRAALADYLGVERSALSRELSRMRKDGLLDFRKNHFIVH